MLHLLPVVVTLANHPEQFADVHADSSSTLVAATKSLYSLVAQQQPATQVRTAQGGRTSQPHWGRTSQPHRGRTPQPPALCVEGFDSEQVWAQVQQLTDPVLMHVDRFFKQMARANDVVLPDKKRKVASDNEDFDMQQDAEDIDDGALDGDLEEGDLEDGDLEDGDLEDEDSEAENLEDEDMADEDGASESAEGMDNDEEDEGEESDEAQGKERFSLEDLDNFAEQEMEADEELGELLDRAYDDDGEDGDKDAEVADNKKDKSKWVLESSDEDTGDESDNMEDKEDGQSDERKTKSRFETEMSQMKEKIKALEDAAVAPKSWTMVGEVSYKERPTNSLLSEDLFFDYSSKPPPIITQERTASLEDIIKQRITKGQWDDVVRKTDVVAEYKPAVELDSSKNTEGLAAVYENQYLKSVHGVQGPESNTQKLQKEAQDLFKEICGKLDALSHFHYTPKRVVAEAHVKTNTPALAVEEATPTAVSNTTLVAPQELLHAPRVLTDKDERSTQENKAHRRHRKDAAKKKKTAAPSGPAAPVSAAAALQELKKDKRVTIVDPKAVGTKTSSSKFFKALQLENDKGGPKPTKLLRSENSKSYKL